MNEAFRRFSVRTASAMGSPWAFTGAVLIIVMWGASGPLFGFSDAWQLVINTSTTILTFLAVFLIQNTQNRDAKAIHLKLDELIRGVGGARTGLVNLEDMPEKDLQELGEDFRRLHEEQRASIDSIGEQLGQLQHSVSHEHTERRPAGRNGRAAR